MLRISPLSKSAVVDVKAPWSSQAPKAIATPAQDHLQVFNSFAKAVPDPAQRVGAILFLGGNGPIDVGVRMAQSQIRIDKAPSDWSHVAVITNWRSGAKPEEVEGYEVTLSPDRQNEHWPERNGVTRFMAAKYFGDAVRYPALAISSLEAPRPVGSKNADPSVKKGSKENARRANSHGATAQPKSGSAPADFNKRMIEALESPLGQRARFPLYEYVGKWLGHLYSGDVNPLNAGICHPSAGLVEFAYESAGIDITPGATTPATCPETIWSTVLWWNQPTELGIRRFKTWRSGGVKSGLLRRDPANT